MDTVVLGAKTLPVDGRQVGLMRDSTSIAGDSAALARRLETDGYLLLRDFFPKDIVLAAQRRVVATMQQRGEPLHSGPGGGDVFVADGFGHATANSVGAYDRNGAPPHPTATAFPRAAR